MNIMSKCLGIAAIGLTLTGCVSSQDHRKVVAERDVLRQEVVSLHLKAEAYRNQAGAEVAAGAAKDAQIVNLSSQNTELQAKLDEINAKYTEATDMTDRDAGTNALPAQLSGELAALAAGNADFMQFDAARGMIKFKSDVTFGSGSADLTPEGKKAVAKLAKILTSASADGYELMIAGHTDNVKVTRADTIKKGHIDNWHLSAHRAIAVGKELRGAQVSDKRLAMVGYADQRPVADNATPAGRAMNRRVEILVLPIKVQPSVAQTKTPAPTTQSSEPDTTASTDSAPMLNK